MRRWGIILVLLLWLSWHLAVPINLTVVDIGRHIKNGELLLQGTWDVLYKNFYSYTYGNYPFINHHWFFGVIVYLFWHWFDFGGLSFTYVLMELATFWLFFRRAERFSSLALACAFGLLSFPLLTYRLEIRPEGLSMLFCGLFWTLLSAYSRPELAAGQDRQDRRLKANILSTSLACLEVIWVNTHVFFLMGPVLTALCWWQAKIDRQKEQANVLKKTLWLVLGMCLLNPSGLAGALVPLNIFKGFGYRIVENQTVFFMCRRFPQDPIFLYFLMAVAVLMLPWLALLKREGFRKHAPMLVLMVFLSLSAIKAVRLITPFGFFWIALCAYAWGRWMQVWPVHLRKIVVTIFLIGGVLASALVRFSWRQKPAFGLTPSVNNSVQFFKDAGLSGRIFNNYDIGGYLIFHLSPQQKFFVDNRMEAFPAGFFKDVYIPTQTNNALWQRMDAQYDFNVIFFDIHDLTDWGQTFLINRIKDPLWAPVYVDSYTIIFLKRNAQNAFLIRRYELPSNMFYIH